MRFLIPFTLLFLYHSVFSQIKKVEGYVGSIPYDCITQFRDNNFTVERKGGFAILNLDGTVVGSGIKAPTVGFIKKFQIDYGVYFAQEGDNIVLKNLAGQKLSTGNYMEILPFETDNTVARVRTPQGQWIVAYLDAAGKEIVRFDVRKYLLIAEPQSKLSGFGFVMLNNFLPFYEGLTPIKGSSSGKYGYVNKKLQMAIPVSFKQASPFSEGLAAVQNNDGNWGYINTNGKLVIPFNYSRRPFRFSSGLAKVENNEGHFGYINKANKLIIPAQYEYATHFYKGYALVRENYNHPALLIDTTGAIITRFPDGASYIDNAKPGTGISGEEKPEHPFYAPATLRQLVDEGKGIFTKGGSYGLIDKKGNIVLDLKYDYLSDYHAGKMFVHKSEFINGSIKTTDGIMNEKEEMIINIVKPEF